MSKQKYYWWNHIRLPKAGVLNGNSYQIWCQTDISSTINGYVYNYTGRPKIINGCEICSIRAVTFIYCKFWSLISEDHWTYLLKSDDLRKGVSKNLQINQRTNKLSWRHPKGLSAIARSWHSNGRNAINTECRSPPEDLVKRNPMKVIDWSNNWIWRK